MYSTITCALCHVPLQQLVRFLVQGEEQGDMSISLPRVSSAELLLFPETAEGHVSKVCGGNATVVAAVC